MSRDALETVNVATAPGHCASGRSLARTRAFSCARLLSESDAPAVTWLQLSPRWVLYIPYPYCAFCSPLAIFLPAQFSCSVKVTETCPEGRLLRSRSPGTVRLRTPRYLKLVYARSQHGPPTKHLRNSSLEQEPDPIGNGQRKAQMDGV